MFIYALSVRLLDSFLIYAFPCSIQAPVLTYRGKPTIPLLHPKLCLTQSPNPSTSQNNKKNQMLSPRLLIPRFRKLTVLILLSYLADPA